MKNSVKSVLTSIAQRLGVSQPESRLISDAGEFWSSTNSRGHPKNSHWRQGFNEASWLELGGLHRRLFDELTGVAPLSMPLARIVEWGSGGGANAVHFAPLADEYVGVDVSQASLEECAAQVASVSAGRFRAVHIDIREPEKACVEIGPCEFFLCTYVFELLPTEKYGLRLLRIAEQLLTPGGLALIQIKYIDGRQGTRPRRWGYRLNMANMTTYRIEAFWEHAVNAGLTPLLVKLMPKQPLVNDERYAYFLLQKYHAG